MDISQLLTVVVAGGVSIKYFFKLFEKPIADEAEKDKKSMVPRKSNDSYVEELEKKDSVNQHEDESIIDVTDQVYEIKFDDNLSSTADERKLEGKEERLKKYQGSGDRKHDIESLSKIIYRSDEIKKEISLKNHSKIKVPHWKHQYVYSHEEIYDASDEQKEFYEKFKNRFLNGEYIDLEGNSNYCFILLFDLFDEYQNHKDLLKMESQLNNLGQNYSVTAPYARSLLQSRIKNPYLGIQSSSLNTSYEYPDYRLGSKYKKILDLSIAEIELLNSIWRTNNSFLDIEFCLIETLKLYIAVIRKLKDVYKEEGKTIEERFLEIGDLIATKHHKYRKGSQNYKYTIRLVEGIVFHNIFKHCESFLRECYGHKRGIDVRLNYKEVIIQTEYELTVTSKVSKILETLSSKVSEPTEAAEIELNIQSVNRWKDKFNHIKEVCGNDTQEFLKSVSLLEKLNKKNPSLKNLLLEISKFLSKQSKELSLAYYIKYLYYFSDSKGLEDKDFIQSLHKSLFKTAEQLDDFKKIVNDLIKDRDLDKALNAADKFYEIKRKKIELNKLSIQAAKQQHSETVNLLSEYLKEDDHESATSQEIPKEILKEDIVQGNNSTFVSDISFNEIQAALVGLFEKNNFSIPRSDLEIFARSNSVFESRIIESINEACYDILDDVLIEEEDDFYTMSQSYFNKIQKNDR